MDASLELVVDCKATLGEGPIWDPHHEVVWWVDIFGQRLHRFDPSSGHDDVFDVGEMIGTVVVRKSGGLVLALENGFAFFDPVTNAIERVSDPETHLSENRFNDGKCDPTGRFWAGTMSKTEEPEKGSLYTLDADLRVVTRLTGISVANGIVWSSDGKTMYYIDTPTLRVDAFDFDPASGNLSRRRTVVTVADGMGYPDGMAIDAEDKLWVGMWGGAHVLRFDPLSGALLAKIAVPASNVTACAFGGVDLHDLYITTARVGLSPQDLLPQPHAGGLFRTRLPMSGVKSAAFSG